MSSSAGTEVKCECGRIIATPTLTPAGIVIRNNLHKQGILILPGGISIRGNCPSCSSRHTIPYTVAAPPSQPKQKRSRTVQTPGQLSLF